MSSKNIQFPISNLSRVKSRDFKYPILGVILLLAVFLRFFWFGVVPPSLNWDETSLGYNAYSILKTGKDEWGRMFPLTFEAFGDFKLPGYIYTTVPFVALLGLSEWAVRLPSMIAGVFSVGLLYWIVVTESKNQKWALVSALLLAISPWHTFLSRAALEANLALCFFLVGIYFLIVGYKKRSLGFLSGSALFFGLTLFTYNSARVFVPLFLAAVALSKIGELRQIKELKVKLIIPAVIFLIFIGVAGFLALTQDSASRYYWVAIVDEGAINFLNESRGASTLPEVATKLIYNRYSYFAFVFAKNYLSHFSPQFLFLAGGDNYQFSVQQMGLMYAIEAPFLIYGLLKIWKYPSAAKLFMAWLLLAPIPAAITRESPHVLRSIFMLGALQAIVGVGMTDVWIWLKDRLRIVAVSGVVVVTLLMIINSYWYFSTYFLEYPKQYSQSWQYGYKEAINFVMTKENVNNRPLFISKKYGEAHIFYLFYNQYDPGQYQTNPNLIRYPQSNWRWVDRLDNVYFINDWEMKDKLKDQHGYVISTPGNYPGIPPVLKRIDFLDGKGAFEVVEI